MGCGVGLEKADSSGDRGECGDGGMLREDDLKGTGVILRPILLLLMMMMKKTRVMVGVK